MKLAGEANDHRGIQRLPLPQTVGGEFSLFIDPEIQSTAGDRGCDRTDTLPPGRRRRPRSLQNRRGGDRRRRRDGPRAKDSKQHRLRNKYSPRPFGPGLGSSRIGLSQCLCPDTRSRKKCGEPFPALSVIPEWIENPVFKASHNPPVDGKQAARRRITDIRSKALQRNPDRSVGHRVPHPRIGSIQQRRVGCHTGEARRKGDPTVSPARRHEQHRSRASLPPDRAVRREIDFQGTVLRGARPRQDAGYDQDRETHLPHHPPRDDPGSTDTHRRP